MRKSLSVVMTVLAVLLVASALISCNNDPKTFTVTFNPGAAEGEAYTQSVVSGKETKLDANTFTNEGYIFVGWATSDSGEVVYADQAPVTLTADLALYAIWSKEYSITVTAVEGGTAEPSMKSYAISDSIQVITLTVSPDDTHYLGDIKLVGSANTEAFRLFRTVVIPMDSIGDIVITPVFKEKPVNIGYKEVTWNGTSLETSDETIDSASCIILNDDTKNWSDGWYVAADDLVIKDRITVSGNVKLILTDSATLKAEQGITVQKTATLTIYSQQLGLGVLIVNRVSFKNAGIGGTADTDCGTIEIKGGMLQVNGSGNGAGIGSGEGKQAGIINIYRGLIYATGGQNGAGIGGGNGSGGAIVKIYGGSVMAQGGMMGAGIGGGTSGDGGTFTIYGGAVLATGGDYGAGIGGGKNGIGGAQTFEGGNVTAKGGNCAAGIGGGLDAKGVLIEINGGTIKAYGKAGGAGIGGGQFGNSGTVSISGGNVTAIGFQDAAEYRAGAGIGGGSDNGGITQGGACETVNITGGIITATGGRGSAGIGGGCIGSGGTISISGDDTVVVATGGDGAAGIGGGACWHMEHITISGGKVTAIAGEAAAGIGSGTDGGGGTVTIRGASTKVYASYGANGAKYAIGPGNHVEVMGDLELESGATMQVSDDGENWSDYDGSHRKPYMKTPSY